MVDNDRLTHTKITIAKIGDDCDAYEYRPMGRLDGDRQLFILLTQHQLDGEDCECLVCILQATLIERIWEDMEVPR